MSNIPDNISQVSSDEQSSFTTPGDGAIGTMSPHDPTQDSDPQGASVGGTDLSARLQQAEDEIAQLKDAWLRAKAETDNARKQGQNDVAKAHKYAVERFAQELLTVKDSLELALATPKATLEALKDGVALTLKNLNAAFDKAQIVEINPVGEKYDPHREQAMTMIESDQSPGTVLQVFQKGYLINDRVLRPALVAVAKAGDDSASDAE